jgi:hypothetical protein
MIRTRSNFRIGYLNLGFKWPCILSLQGHVLVSRLTGHLSVEFVALLKSTSLEKRGFLHQESAQSKESN